MTRRATNKRAILDALALGTIAGMRAALPLAGLSLTLRRLRHARLPIALAAAGELIYDKLPKARDRTSPPLLAGRAISGTLAGLLAARALGASTVICATVGGLAAIGSSFLFHRLRAEAVKRTPAAVAAVGEDLLAVGLSEAALRPLR